MKPGLYGESIKALRYNIKVCLWEELGSRGGMFYLYGKCCQNHLQQDDANKEKKPTTQSSF